MKQIIVSLMAAISLVLVSHSFAEDLVVVIGGNETIWSRTSSSSTWTQVPGSLVTASVAWDAANNYFVLYGAEANGEIWSCTFDSSGNFQNDWVSVGGWARDVSVASSLAEDLVVVIGGNETIWSRTSSSSTWTQVPGSLVTASVAWDAANNYFVLYGAEANGGIWSCTFDSSGNFQNDWVSVGGWARDVSVASSPGSTRTLTVWPNNFQFKVVSTPAGICCDCPPPEDTCSASFPIGTVVTLNAIPLAQGYASCLWGGCDSNPNAFACTVTMDRDRQVSENCVTGP